MNSGWRQVRLDEIASISAGNSAPQAAALFKDGTHPFFRTSDVGKVHIGTIDGSEDKLNDKGIKGLRLYPAGTILMPKSGASTFLDHRVMMRREGYVSSHLATIQAKVGVVDPKFLFYALLTVEARSIAPDATYPTLSLADIKAIHIALPDLEEQRRIVAILDEAFAAIATATAHTEKNILNARAIFDRRLRQVFDNASDLFVGGQPVLDRQFLRNVKHSVFDGATKTGGRAATTRPLIGNYSLCVLMPNVPARNGWRWSPLQELARMESGHTPSRKHPEYWNGAIPIPWITLTDAKRAHGTTITQTEESVTEAGIGNSSARLLPEGTVCLSRTASIGYVTVMGRPMATSQDFVDWVCSDQLEPNFLKYLFLAQGTELSKFSSGAVHQTIYFPEAKAFCICLPNVRVQQQIVQHLDRLRSNTQKLEATGRTKLLHLVELRRSVLRKAFAGGLASNVVPFPRTVANITTTDLHAGILALAYQKHLDRGVANTLQHVKAEKIAHMVEAVAGIDLGRAPMKDAAGPNDFPHLHQVQHRADKANFFAFRQTEKGYHFEEKNGFARLIERTRSVLGDSAAGVDAILDSMVPMDSRQAEIFATVFAAWNNLLLDGEQPSDEEIVQAAREDWHPDKLKIERARFFAAIEWMREHNVVPQGIGKRVAERQAR